MVAGDGGVRRCLRFGNGYGAGSETDVKTKNEVESGLVITNVRNERDRDESAVGDKSPEGIDAATLPFGVSSEPGVGSALGSVRVSVRQASLAASPSFPSLLVTRASPVSSSLSASSSFANCTCNSVERFLHCYENMLPRVGIRDRSHRGGSGATRRRREAPARRLCPVCHRTKVRRLPGSQELSCREPQLDAPWCEHTSGSVCGELLYTGIDGMVCDVSFFKQISAPMLHIHPDCPDFHAVYVPHMKDMCRRVCEVLPWLSSDRQIGRGAFGEVWLVNRRHVAKKSKEVSEVVLTAWVSGVIRARAQSRGVHGEGVHMNLLTPTACCLRHHVTTGSYISMDLMRFDRWSLRGLRSYRNAFGELAEALKFLSLECRVSHFDITPMNILVVCGRNAGYEFDKLVLCDYSLTEPHPDLEDKCVVVFEETRTVKRLPASIFKLSECYHPAFRPIPLQRIVAANPFALFPNGSTQRYCVAELCALANVLLFCMVRFLDQRGMDKVKETHETGLFDASSNACVAMESGDLSMYARCCLEILARQLGYMHLVFGESAATVVDRTCWYVDMYCRRAWAFDFRNRYVNICRDMDRSCVLENVERVLADADGSKLMSTLREMMTIVSEADMSVDPMPLFAA